LLLRLTHLPRDAFDPGPADTMHTLLNTRLTRAALKAARPARRHLIRALRHHAARTRALAEQVRETKPVDGMRAWFHSFFSVLRVRSGARHFSLRTLLYRPATPLRKLNSPASTPSLPSSRRPRRMAATSDGWFAFAMR
jgi:hypothetical protein